MCVPLSQMDTDRQEALFKAMACPDFYPHAVRHVTQEETHISKVFLTGGDVYKIKKAVDLGFLDFSSLARRRRYCELEVTLNRRLTHQVYLGVIPITYADNRFHLAGPGRVVEFAVRMRQLPEACSLASLLEQDRITAQQIETLAVTMTDFYARQRRISPEQAAASWKNVRAACEENFKKTKWAEGGPLDAELYQAVRAATFAFLTRRKALFNDRSESGKIYDGHGDLRSSHIYYTGPHRIQVIDCIEFNARLRHIDIASDLAFLAMDLDFRGAPGLGATLLDGYIRQTRDWQAYALMPFYKCYRAMVRCKVNCIRLAANHGGGSDRITIQRRANRYLAFANRYAEHFTRPTVWVLGGLPGAGKSVLAGILSQKLMLPSLRTDVIRKRLFGQITREPTAACRAYELYSPAAHRLTYDELLRQARNALSQTNSIILDATFSHPEDRRQVLRMTNELRCRAVFVECTAPDDVLKARLAQREGAPSVSDARPRHFAMLKQRYVPMDELGPALRCQVDTTRPIHDCVHAILAWDYRASLSGWCREKHGGP
ncbi:MAG: AAA family ATPase [Desulfobacterales bacterium]|nr:AAA family ATPase [Desulfobacterales bacterium]